MAGRRHRPPTSGNEAPLDEQLGKAGALRGDADVSEQRQLHAPTDARPVHRRDDRLVAVQRRHRSGRGPAGSRSGFGRAAFARHHLLHVLAGAEGGIGTGDDYAAHSVIRGGNTEGRLNLVIGALVEGVTTFRPVQRGHGNPVRDLVAQMNELGRGRQH